MNTRDTIPPQNLEAEQSVLGAMLIDRRAIEKASEHLTAEQFYRDAHQRIYQAIVDVAQCEAADLVTVSNHLRDKQLLDQCGGMSYLATLPDLVPTTANVDYYCGIVHKKFLCRRVIEAGATMQGWGYEQPDEAEVIVTRCMELIDAISPAAGRTLPTVADLLDEADEYIRKGRAARIPCGIETLDDYMDGGMMPGFFTLVGADPGYGKTRHVTRVAFNLLQRGVGVGMLSLEIPRPEIMAELIAMQAGVNRQSLGNGEDGDFMAVTPDSREYRTARAEVAKWRWCLHGEAVDADEIQPLARRMVRERGISVLIVDYAGLVDVRGSRGPERMEAVSQALAQTYKRLGITGIVLCHVTKQNGEVSPWYSRKLDQDCQSFWYIVPPDSLNEGIQYDWKNIKNRYARRSRHTLHLGWNAEFGYYTDLPYEQRGLR